MFLNMVFVGAGGFIGSVGRYLVYQLLRPHFSSFPVSTLIINVLGCFLIGVFSGFAEKQAPVHASLVLFLIVGVLGGFTTFSAFGLETMDLIRAQQLTLAVLNILLSLVLGLGAVWIGRWLTVGAS
jgi:CrcB protein